MHREIARRINPMKAISIAAPGKLEIIENQNHQLNWWFDFDPIRV